MVWKQDLAKLKQQLQEAGEPNAKAPLPKPVPKPAAPANLSMEEQDSLFLNAMGQRPAPSVRPKVKVPQTQEIAVSSESHAVPAVMPEEDFQAAMGGLKGVKLMAPRTPDAKPKAEREAPAVPAPAEAIMAIPSAVTIDPPPVPVPVQPTRAMPERIQLAAGMAIEVDGSLDLRGHTTVDAMERFRERLQDGVFLGWRTFHVLFGASPELGEAFQAFLASSEAQDIARYAQAPIPMGGNQAWILYYSTPGH